MTTNIKTWAERCEEHPAHSGIVSERMIQARMQEEIDELRERLEGACWLLSYLVQWSEDGGLDIYDLAHGAEDLLSTIERDWREVYSDDEEDEDE